MLSQLQNMVMKEQCNQHGAIAAALLMESTEAIMLQAAHTDILELNTTTIRMPPPPQHPWVPPMLPEPLQHPKSFWGIAMP